MCRRYSPTVVAAMHLKSPRESGGFKRLAASSTMPSALRGDDGVQLVDKDYDLGMGGNFGDDLRQPFLEFAAVFRTRRESSHVQFHDALAGQHLGVFALRNTDGESLDDGGLSHAGFPDKHGIVLRTSRQSLDHL